MNTKKSTLLLLCAFGMTFCASVGAATYFATAETSGTEPTPSILTMTEGASIRISDPGGIRFESTLSRENYDTLIGKGAEFYTLILPEKLVPAGGITKDNYSGLDAEKVKAVNSFEVGETTVTFSGVLAGLSNGDGTYQPLPPQLYTMPLTAVSYYTYTDTENGTTVTEFASNPQTYSIAYIASALQAKGYKNDYYTKITDTVLDAALPNGITLSASSDTVKAGKTIETKLEANGLKAKYTTDNKSVATVDENGVVKGVGKGKATITATIGSKTDSVEVDVTSIFNNNPIYESDQTRMFAESVDGNGNVSATVKGTAYAESEATFDIDPGTLYYAEATFTLNGSFSLGKYPMIGLAHFKTLNKTVGAGDVYNNAGKLLGRNCWESVLSGNGKYLIKDLNDTEDHWYENFEKNNLYLHRTFKANTAYSEMTIAIARSGNTIYTFVDNGQLIQVADIPWADVEAGTQTTPGVIVCCSPNNVTISNVTVLSGADAQAKIDSVNSQASILGNNPSHDSSKLRTYQEFLGEDGDVKLQSGRYGEIAATFNTQKSTLYYAEAKFSGLKQATDGSYTSFGLAHFKSLETSVDETAHPFNEAGTRYGRDCVISAKSGTSDTFIVGTLPASTQCWYNCTQLYKDPNFAAKGTPMKIAIARTDTMMYTFVNDKLVDSQAMPAGYTDATTPGIITIGDTYSFVISDVTVLTNENAVDEKFLELTGKSVFSVNPAYSDGSRAYEQTTDESGNVTSVSSSQNGELAATFKTDASTLYYAEATFYVTNTSDPKDYPAFGLAHYLALNTSVNEAHTEVYDGGSRLGRECVASIKSGSSATFLIANLTASIERWWQVADSSNELDKKTDFQANTFKTMKIAIARTEDTLYTFVNGELVQAIEAPANYKGVATTPGIITISNANTFTVSNIQLLSGGEAQAKINELTGTNPAPNP